MPGNGPLFWARDDRFHGAGSLVMERKMLLTIKELAEGLSTEGDDRLAGEIGRSRAVLR